MISFKTTDVSKTFEISSMPLLENGVFQYNSLKNLNIIYVYVHIEH